MAETERQNRLFHQLREPSVVAPLVDVASKYMNMERAKETRHVYMCFHSMSDLERFTVGDRNMNVKFHYADLDLKDPALISKVNKQEILGLQTDKLTIALTFAVLDTEGSAKACPPSASTNVALDPYNTLVMRLVDT